MNTELDPNEEDPCRLWAEIIRLRAAVAGPDGYSSWQEAATAERVRRVCAERELASVKAPAAPAPEPVVTRESAVTALHHLSRYNGPGRFNEAIAMLAASPAPDSSEAQA